LIALAIALITGSFAISAALTAIVKRLAMRANFLSRPAPDRYQGDKQRIVPLGGGIAISVTLLIIILSAMAFVRFIVAPGHFGRIAEQANVQAVDFLARSNELLIIVACVVVLFAVGLWDDRRHLGPFFKLVVQFAVAIAAAAFAEIRVELFIENRLISSALSALWIVLIINSFNFLDNMDGASAGIAVIVSSILFVAAAFSGQVFVGGMALVFIGTLTGFLVFNFPPAGIFMGDAGSLVVGFFVALLTLRTTYYHEAQSGQWYPIFMPLIVMAVPLYDFISVTLLRIGQGKSPFVGDTQHFSHRLKRHGLTDAQTALTLYLATLCTGLGATFLYQVDLTGTILIFAQTIMVLSIIAVFESTSK
jgi:UDP-GlcNAc:undecaprenyl-phosphate GlcNAc-1-phosphate transferase